MDVPIEALKTGSDRSQLVFYWSSNFKIVRDRRPDCGLRSFAVLGICGPNQSWSGPVPVDFQTLAISESDVANELSWEELWLVDPNDIAESDTEVIDSV